MECVNPIAFRDLRTLKSLRVTCECCRYQVDISPRELRRIHAGGVRTYGALWEHAFCPTCRAIGQAGYRIILEARWASGEPQTTILPAKTPAGGPRTTPLPRRRLYRRKAHSA